MQIANRLASLSPLSLALIKKVINESMDVPLVHALAEDYHLEEIATAKTRFTYSVAIEPRVALRMGGSIARTRLDSILKNACKGLQSYIVEAGTLSRAGGAL